MADWLESGWEPVWENSTERDVDLKGVKRNLNALKNEILPPDALSLVDEVDKVPSQDVVAPKFWEYIQKKDYVGALMEVFALRSRYVDAWKPGLEKFKWLKEKTTQLGLGAYTEQQLMWYVTYLEGKVAQSESIKRRVEFVYVLSQVKDALVTKKRATDSEPLGQYALLQKQLSVGDVLLLNKEAKQSATKKTTWIWDNTGDLVGDLLKSYDDTTPLDFIHSVMVTKIENGKAYITHATMHRIGSAHAGTSGIEEIELEEYLRHFVSADIMVLSPPETHKKKALTFVEQKLGQGAKYDFLSAASTAIRWKHEINDAYNCAELVAVGMDIDEVKHVTHPNDFMGSRFLKPVYLTTLSNKSSAGIV